MNLGKILKAGIAVAIVLVILDYLSMNYVMKSFLASQPFLREAPVAGMVWNYIGDLVAALVFVWVFDRVQGSFAAGMSGGLAFGFYAGVLTNFPLWIFLHMFIKDFSYQSAWVFTAWGVIVSLIMGAVTGAVHGGSGGGAKAAA